MIKLEDRWIELNAGTDTGLVSESWDQLQQHYSEAGRYYHNLGHIDQMFMLFDRYQDKLTDAPTVSYSIFYHDVIYRPGRSDNEERSAQVASEALKLLGLPDDQIQTVMHYIRVTRDHHQSNWEENDLKYFIDVDLSILASDRHSYRDYLKKIRKEFSYLDNLHFKWGRKAYVQNWLKLPFIFFTDDFRINEQKAKENLHWELEEGLQEI